MTVSSVYILLKYMTCMVRFSFSDTRVRFSLILHELTLSDGCFFFIERLPLIAQLPLPGLLFVYQVFHSYIHEGSY